jgi:ankyrin repeat protein
MRTVYQPETGELFKLCQEGHLAVSTLASITNVTELRDIDNRSLFEVAVEHHCFDIVNYLLQFDVMPKDSESQISIMAAAINTGLLPFVKQLADKMDFHPFFSGDDVYEFACKLGHLDIMDYIRRTVKHYPPEAFVSACNYGHIDVARTFFSSSETSADDSVYDRSLFTTDLTQAILNDCVDAKDIQPVFDFLIENNLVDPHSSSFWGAVGQGCATIPFIKHVLSIYEPTHNNIFDALVSACLHGRLETLRFLLEWSAEHRSRLPNVLGTKNLAQVLKSVFCGTCRGDVMEEAVTIVFERLNIEMLDSYDSNMLLKEAVSHGFRTMVAAIVSHGRCNVNQREYYRFPGDITCHHPLISEASDPAIVKLLLDANAVVVNPNNETVFAAACKGLRVDSVKMLLEAKADVNAGRGVSALQHALRDACGDEKADDMAAILRLLLGAGADTRRAGRFDTVLELCIDTIKGSASTAKALLLLDPSLISRSANGTPLMYACRASKRDPALFKVLIDAGDDVNACDDKGYSIMALLLTTVKGRSYDFICYSPRETQESMHSLLRAGADPLFYNNGHTLMMMALMAEQHGATYTDGACSALIADLVEFILHRRVVATQHRPLRPYSMRRRSRSVMRE